MVTYSRRLAMVHRIKGDIYSVSHLSQVYFTVHHLLLLLAACSEPITPRDSCHLFYQSNTYSCLSPDIPTFPPLALLPTILPPRHARTASRSSLPHEHTSSVARQNLLFLTCRWNPRLRHRERTPSLRRRRRDGGRRHCEVIIAKPSTAIAVPFAKRLHLQDPYPDLVRRTVLNISLKSF